MNPEQFARFRKTPKFNEKLYNIGRVAEAEVLDKLRVYFDDELIHALPEGDSFDFVGTYKYIELKSRSVYRFTYEDTAIGVGKINKALADQSNNYYFVFKFVNGLFYIKLDKTIELRLGKINNIDHYFIKVRDLTEIE
jgi:hypothetical protein